RASRRGGARPSETRRRADLRGRAASCPRPVLRRTLRPADRARRGAAPPARRALLAAVAAAILAREAPPLRGGAEDLAPAAVLEDDLVAAGEDLERPPDLFQPVELHRPRLVEVLEVGGIHEIGHRVAFDADAGRLR